MKVKPRRRDSLRRCIYIFMMYFINYGSTLNKTKKLRGLKCEHQRFLLLSAVTVSKAGLETVGPRDLSSNCCHYRSTRHSPTPGPGPMQYPDQSAAQNAYTSTVVHTLDLYSAYFQFFHPLICSPKLALSLAAVVPRSMYL